MPDRQANGAAGQLKVLLVVPPFASVDYPSLGAHLLQACARRQRFTVDVLYANVLLAARLGARMYGAITCAPTPALLGERFFARTAFGLPPLGRSPQRMFLLEHSVGPAKAQIVRIRPDADYLEGQGLHLDDLLRAEAEMEGWLREIAGRIARGRYAVVGATTTFQQTNASLALLQAVRQLQPRPVTILGGANCEGEMGEAIAALGEAPDYVFSGESEASFVAFLEELVEGRRPGGGVLTGAPVFDLDTLPIPDYGEFYEQRRALPAEWPSAAHECKVPCESSRGCWWGAKAHCTFCGLNGKTMTPRVKSPERVLAELQVLVAAAPTRHVAMVDNIMPVEYFRTVLPRLPRELPAVSIFYEQKSNLSLRQVLDLARAGVDVIQPGIESLSSSTLKLMRKGVTARQNIALLRYGRAAGVRTDWNLLWGFPQEAPESIEEMLAVVPLLHHLQPPMGLFHISLDRFSPYFLRPGDFGIENLRPLSSYHDVLPDTAEVAGVAYHFVGDYASGVYERLDSVVRLRQEVDRWRDAWSADRHARPELRIQPIAGGFALVDTRAIPGCERLRLLAPDEAARLARPARATGERAQRELVEQKLAVVVDGWFTPLIVADPAALLVWEAGGEVSAEAAASKAGDLDWAASEVARAVAAERPAGTAIG